MNKRSIPPVTKVAILLRLRLFRTSPRSPSTFIASSAKNFTKSFIIVNIEPRKPGVLLFTSPLIKPTNFESALDILVPIQLTQIILLFQQQCILMAFPHSIILIQI